MRLARSMKFIGIFLLVGVLLLGPSQMASAAISFGSQINLSNNVGSSTSVQLSSSGNNVYAVWQDDNEIFFANSTDNGVTFDPDGPFNISNTVGNSIAPDISANGSSVYIVWDDGLDILFKASNDNGNSFGNFIPLSATPSDASVPQIASSGNNVYVVWKDDNKIFFTNSTDNGLTFSLPFQLSVTAGSLFAPTIFALGNNVYVAWHNTLLNDDVFFRASTDGGISFGNEINLSDNPSISITPQLSASENNVYVVWQDNTPGNNEIFFINSTDNGATFDVDGPFNLSNSVAQSSRAQISATGSNVYVTWQDSAPNNEIIFRKSNDNSASFSSPKNLSTNAGSSTVSQIGSSGNNVYVVWQDSTSGILDILFKVSENSGDSFGGVTNLSTNGAGDASLNAQIISEGTNVYVTWQSLISGNNEILFRAGTPTPIDIEFNATQYKLSDTAIVNVTDAASNIDSGAIDSINVNVNSTSDAIGISISLSETGFDTGNFTGQLTFTTGASGGTALQTAPGETINANFGGQQGTASMFPRTIGFNFGNYDLGSTANVIVNDQHANLDSLVNETISVLITSGADPVGINLQLNETGPNSGQFGNVFNNKLIFMPGDYLFSTTDSVTISQKDLDDNSTVGVDTSYVRVKSTTDPVGIILSLDETSGISAVFEGILTFTTNPSINGSSIQVNPGDFLTIAHKTIWVTKGMIIPNSDPTNGAIKVINPAPDVVTAAYLGLLANTNVATGDAPGGGGGGIVRPGLVLNALAGIQTLLGGGGGGTSKPTISSTSLTIDSGVSFAQQGDDLEFGGIITEKKLDDALVPQVVKTGKPIELKFDLYENSGINNIIHLSLYILNEGEKPDYTKSTFVLYDKYDGIKINDPEDILGDATISIFKTSATTGIGKISLEFKEAVGTKDFFIKLWDERRNANEWKFENAINVIESNSVEESNGIVILETDVQSTQSESDLIGIIDKQLIADEEKPSVVNIKPWIKTTAKWWVNDQVDDPEFLMAIEFLIDEGIIEVQYDEPISSNSVGYVPPWFRFSAEWWSEGELSDEEFTDGLQWLIENGVMRV